MAGTVYRVEGERVERRVVLGVRRRKRDTGSSVQGYTWQVCAYNMLTILQNQ